MNNGGPFLKTNYKIADGDAFTNAYIFLKSGQ